MALLVCLANPSTGRAADDADEITAPEEIEDADYGLEDDVIMERIVIVGSRGEEAWLKTPASVSVVYAEDVRRAQQQLTLGESLGNLPGVYVQNRTNFAQDARISIRGFGARAPFGIRGIKLIVDGIPLTMPDGQGQVDSLDLSSVERIEVLRGPGASLYGSSAGGVIEVTSTLGTADPFVRGRLVGGTYGFLSESAQAAGQVEDWSYAIGLSHFEIDGYRDHSESESVLLNTKFRVEVDNKTSMTVLLNHVDAPDAKDPGGLLAEEVADERQQANRRNIDMKSGETLENTTFGLSLQHTYNEQHETNVSSYFTWRDFDGRVPSTSRGAIDLNRFLFGAALKHTYDSVVFGRDHRLTAGFEVADQSDRRKQRAIDLMTGEVGDLAVNELQKVTSLGGFVHGKVSIIPNLQLSASARYDWVRYQVTDDFVANGNDSDVRHFDELSFAGAILYNAFDLANPFFRVATSFETPTTTSFANPVEDAGGFNRDLEPQTAIHYELGSKGGLDRWFEYEVAVFYIRVEDELLPYSRDFTTFYENAESSDRIGLELAFRVQLNPDLAANASYTYSHFEFDEFTDGNGNNFDGARIPGVPRNMASLSFDYQNPLGLFGALEFQYIDEREADNANSAEAEDYLVVNLRVGYEREYRGFDLGIFGAINNMTGQRYTDNLRINDGNMRFFEPAVGLNFHYGVSASYHF